MTLQQNSTTGNTLPNDPRPVSRGSKLHSAFIGLDSLYLVGEYPHRDVYDIWAEAINHDLDHLRLRREIPHGDCVIRVGGLGYKLSVWEGDARLFLTDYVEDTLIGTAREGQGAGFMLQLGPKWLRRYESLENIEAFKIAIYAQLAFFGVMKPQNYRMRLNRIDIALDIVNLPLDTINPTEFSQNWVGYANRGTYYESHSRFEGLARGTSGGAIRFKIYDKVTESLKNKSLDFWTSVWEFDEPPETILRFEWTIKAYQAGFNQMKYLDELTTEGLYAALNYASSKWGRWCEPDPNNSNKARWALHPIWVEVQRLIQEWNGQFTSLLKRDYEVKPDITDGYIKGLVGWLTGFQARIALQHDYEDPANFYDVLTYLQKVGYSLPDMEDISREKLDILTRLVGELSDSGEDTHGNNSL